MEKIVINGGNSLFGEVNISGMKNAALPIIFACILTKDKCIIENIPLISDVTLSIEILRNMGAEIKFIDDKTVEINTENFVGGCSPCDLVCKMRASTYLLGAELGRFGKTKIGLPGGCNFGSRPLDQHIKGFEALGATVDKSDGEITAITENGTHGGSVYFDITSVGATINVMLASVLAKGDTVIENAACEPHIVDLANFLNTCGASIFGAGTNIIRIHGVDSLHGCTYEIIPDMIEAGTFMAAVAATGGCVTINNIIPKHMESVSAKLRDMGATVEEFDESLKVTVNSKLKPTRVLTNPYPGFPTDMHPQFVALMCTVEGDSVMSENVFDHRFQYVDELIKFGASIETEGKVANVHGGNKLIGTEVHSVDLRAGAAMIIAGLCAKGTTTITGVNYINRGYHNIVEKLSSIGADIKKI